MNKHVSKKNEKHKFVPECLNSCVEWKLNCSIVQNKTSLGYV